MSDGVSRWPGNYRCALVVSVDVDGPYGHINANGDRDFFWRSQTAYDLPAGVPRLLDLLNDRDVEATFCWVGRCAADRPDLVQRSHADGHEIALHSWEHRYYTPMTADEQREDMLRTSNVLESLTGERPVGHKTPAWRYNEATAAVAQELGLLWRMDEAGGDLPWLVQPDAQLPPLVELPPSRWYDDYTYFVEQTIPPRSTAEFWRDDLDVLRDEGKLLCLTLHPFVSGRPGPSRALADLLDYAIDLGDVWIARADRIALYWRDQTGGTSRSTIDN
ncbi:MAG: hypothetical protein DCC58_00840 [Chloroflexi bacterium]|nr:MAG: hypothetical protein DCC58_00840 [Chloroflexota bacterium]